MSDTTEDDRKAKTTLSLGGSRGKMSLKGGDSGTVKQSFSHGRSKSVQVEHKRKRVVERGAEGDGYGRRGPGKGRAGPATRGLTDAERENRERVLRVLRKTEGAGSEGSSLPPPPLVLGQQDEARALMAKIADALDYVGVLTGEFFSTDDGPVFNEMAPRVHNSGHWTIEGAAVSQFENHIRAVVGLPLGSTATAALPVTMRNLIGADIESVPALLADDAAHVHHYGKAAVRDGRKLGHVTWVGTTPV